MQTRSAIAAGLGAAALAVPSVNAWAAAVEKAAPKTKVTTARRAFTGPLGDAGQWGQVQVQLVVKKTTTIVLKTHKQSVTRRIVSVRVPVYPDHSFRSVFINQQALPILAQETLQAQSATIDMVSGATYTSNGFEQSLQGVILQAKSW